MAERSWAFFQNRACPYFPCHEGVPPDAFNCLFCWCPLYTLGDRCGGDHTWTEKGIKSCIGCAFPHRRENYDRIVERAGELAALAREGREHV